MTDPSITAPIAVKVTDLAIRYSTYARRTGGITSRNRHRMTVEALSGVSFTVAKGECVGFVGRNGAGKSTLLRTVAGICSPTAGEVLVRDQPLLLGVNAALIAKLTGTTNIELGLLSLGFLRDEVAELAPQVADFTDLGDALNRPIKTYSSGMRSRLAFAIATARKPQILLLDEALAVGDLHFKRRSIRRLNTIRGNAGTILLASHNTTEIQRTCTRVIWMEQGKILEDGPTEEILERYQAAQGAE